MDRLILPYFYYKYYIRQKIVGIFLSKASDYSNGVKLLALPANVRPGCKFLSWTDVLAYSSFSTFKLSLTVGQNKLECLSIENFSSLVYS